jgi:hypothetical protein
LRPIQNELDVFGCPISHAILTKPVAS